MDYTYTKVATLYLMEHYPELQDEILYDWIATDHHHAAVASGSDNMTTESKTDYLDKLAKFAKEYQRA